MTKIPRRLVYVPKIGFVPMAKVVIVSFLLIFGISINVLLKAAISPAEASQLQPRSHIHSVYLSPLAKKQRRIVEYIKSVRPNINNSVANRLADAIIQNSWKYGIPVEIELAVAKHESNFEQYALGSQGELGFFQIMTKPHVGRVFLLLREDEIPTKNIYDPYTNSTLAASILKECLRLRHNNMGRALACYNGTSRAGEYSKVVLAKAREIHELI